MLQRWLSHARRISYHLGKTVRLGGRDFKVRGYYASRLEFSDVRHEKNMVEVFGRVLKSRPGVFLDVGVNIGQSLFKVLSVDPDRTYIGFEPQIACCYNVEQFLLLNRLHTAKLLPVALSDVNGTLKLYSRGDYDEMASLVKNHETTGIQPSAYFVPVRVGDELLGELGVGDICAIKIDVEGAELDVLRGLVTTLRSKRPPVIFEMLPNFYGVHQRVMFPPQTCQKKRAQADAVEALFADVGYEIFQIHDDGSETRIDRFELDDMVAYVGNNYIAHPKVTGNRGTRLSA